MSTHHRQSRYKADRARCYFRNLVYATFREARHLGTRGHHPQYMTSEPKCCEAKRQEDRERVFSVLYNRIRQETDVARIIQPFEELLELGLDDLPNVFGAAARWDDDYGGEKWHVVAELAVALAAAIRDENWAAADALCDRVRRIEHNSGPLVDLSKPYKWKEDCDRIAGSSAPP